MSKILVDRELLERVTNMLDAHNYAKDAEALMAAIAQPAEAEGVSNARLMNTLAELARRAPLRTLHTICETQRQVSTVKLERYLEPVGDTLAGYAFTLRIDFDKLSAALSAVTAERDRLQGEAELSHSVADLLRVERDQLRAEVEALRKDAERYRWLRDKSESLHGFYLSTPIWMTGVRFRPENVDSTIDAAMAAKEG